MMMLHSDKKERMAVALFMILITLIGLWTIGDYTGSYDEIAEQAILASNMKEYAVRLQKIGVCSEYWTNAPVQPISQSVEKDHGISAYYLFGVLFPLLENNEWLRYTLWSVFTWLWFMMGVWSLYAISKRMGASRPVACLACLVLYLSPRFFADGHVNNKDVVLLCLMLVTLWQGMRFLECMSIKRGVLFSVAGAIAMNTKIVGALAWGTVLLCASVKIFLEGENCFKKIKILLWTALFFVISYICLTPALWFDPLNFFSYLFGNATAFSRWSGTIFFRDASFQIPENPLPIYYLVYMMLVTLPLYVFPLSMVGQLDAIRLFIQKPKSFFVSEKGLLLAAATMCWTISVGAFILFRPVVYNGWRHFYFSFAGIVIMAAYGIDVVWRACRKHMWLKRICAAVLSLCFMSTAIGMIHNHPHQSSYYNVLSGDLAMETDYWNTSGTYALKRLIGSEERNKELPIEVGCYFLDIQNARFKLPAEQKNLLTTTVEKTSPYLYYIENYVQVYNVPKPEGYHVLFTVESYGRLIGTMYERDF